MTLDEARDTFIENELRRQVEIAKAVGKTLPADHPVINAYRNGLRRGFKAGYEAALHEVGINDLKEKISILSTSKT